MAGENEKDIPNGERRGLASRIQPIREAWLATFSHVDPNHDGEYFSHKQEYFLSNQIQIGLMAEAKLADASTNQEHTNLQELIEQGKIARQALFEVNIPFALYYARESVGISHPDSQAKMKQDGRQGLFGIGAGTFAPLSSYKSSFADLDDRQQSALEGMWEATGRFLPQNGRPVKFVTYASWYIQKTIADSFKTEEGSGVKLPYTYHDTLRAYFREHPYADANPVPQHIAEQLLRISHTGLDDVVVGPPSWFIDEPDDEDYPNTIEEIYGFSEPQGELSQLLQRDLRTQILHVLNKLDPLAKDVLDKLYGISTGTPLSNKQVGKLLDISTPQINKILTTAYLRLRLPAVNQSLESYFATNEYTRGTVAGPPLQDEGFDSERSRAGDGAVLGLGKTAIAQRTTSFYSVPEQAITLAQHRRHAEIQAWQTYLEESWDEPTYTIEQLHPNLEAYIAEQVKTIILNSQAYHFQTSFGEAVKTPAPIILLKRINMVCRGVHFTTNQVNELFLAFIDQTLPKLYAEIGDDFSIERAQALFSALYKKYTYTDSEEEISERQLQQETILIDTLATLSSASAVLNK